MLRTIGLAHCVLLVALAANAQPEGQFHGPVLFDPSTDARVETLLAPIRDRDSLSRAFGRSTTRCFGVGSSWELCEWQLSRSDSGWHELASVMGVRDRISVLCVLPTNGNPRDPQSCTAHVRRSNRDRWRVSRPVGHLRRDHRPRSNLYETRERYRDIATGMLDDARTLIALSRLLGQTPSSCVAKGAQLDCLWRATSQTWGHGTLATAAGFSDRKKLRLACRLPADGGLRGRNSCQIEIGD